jgi:hypothetical protein
MKDGSFILLSITRGAMRSSLGVARIIERRLVIIFGSDRGNCEGF